VSWSLLDISRRFRINFINDRHSHGSEKILRKIPRYCKVSKYVADPIIVPDVTVKPALSQVALDGMTVGIEVIGSKYLFLARQPSYESQAFYSHLIQTGTECTRAKGVTLMFRY
jgi:hypothetical protein